MKRITGLIVAFMLLAGSAAGNTAAASQSEANTNSARLHTELAGLYYQRNQMGIALSETDLAIRADRNYAPAYSMRGLIHMALHEDKEADEAFQHGLHLDANDSDAQNNYGWFLCQRGHEAESIAHFITAVKNPLYTTPELAYLNAGLCSQKAGKTADAEDYLHRALSLRPGMPQALLAMAEIRFAKGDYPAAKKHFTAFAQQIEMLSPEQLWLAIRIERKLGDRNAEASYGLQLRKNYPDAAETQSLLNGE